MPAPLAPLIAAAARAVGPAILRAVGKGAIRVGVQAVFSGDTDKLNDDLETMQKNLTPQKVESIVQRWIDTEFKPTARSLAREDTGYMKSRIDGEANGYNAELTCDAPYAGYNEEGTSTMSAQPFMEPAEVRKMPKLLDELGDAAAGLNTTRRLG